MRHDISLFDANKDYSFAAEVVGGKSPFLYVGGLFGGVLTSILGGIPAEIYNTNWPFVFGPLFVTLWFFAWIVMPRLHIYYGLSNSQIDTLERFKGIPAEVQAELGGYDSIAKIVKVSNNEELFQLRRRLDQLHSEWEGRRRALAKVAPERDTVANYLETVKVLSDQIKTERNTYEEML